MEENNGWIDAAVEWARNKCGRQRSRRFARKYLADDTHIWAAVGDARATISQEKEATPARTPDDTRVRKISAPEPSVNESRSIQETDRSETRREPQRGAFEGIRREYLATMESSESRPQPIEKIEHVASSLPKTNDGCADFTVEVPGRVESGRQSHRGAIENTRPNAGPMEETLHEDSVLPRDGGHTVEQDTGEGAVEASPARVAKEVISAERLMCDFPRKRARIPWLGAIARRIQRIISGKRL
jgi:hypothetical protein